MTTYRFDFYCRDTDGILRESSKDIKAVTQREAESSFRLFATALWSGRWSMRSVSIVGK